jgi:hypothetical protein
LGSATKPNLAQLGVVLAHAYIAGFVRPLETFFRQFPIVSGRCHNSPGPHPNNKQSMLKTPQAIKL